MCIWFAIALQFVSSSGVDYFPHHLLPTVSNVGVEAGTGGTIFVLIDALRPDHLSPYAGKQQGTPYMQQIAKEGVTFLQYRANANWTRPSVASIMTGLLPYQHGVERDVDRLPVNLPNIAEALQKHGIKTGAVVGNGNAGSAFGFQRGFDWYADTVTHWHGLPTADEVVDLAKDFINQHKHEKYFLWLFMVDPHDPYHAPSPYEMMFVQDPSIPLIRTPHWESKTYPLNIIERMQQTYRGAISYTDRAIGRLLHHLEESKLSQETTIVLSSDHGEAFGEHGVFLHAHHLYEEHIRIPLIIKSPHMTKRGVSVEHVAQSVDLLPTILHLFSAPKPTNVDGMSLVDLLKEPADLSQSRSIVSEFNNFGIHRRSVVVNQNKLIQYLPATIDEFMGTVKNPSLLPSVQFDQTKWYAYNLRQDPFEKKSVYSKSLFQQSDWRNIEKILQDLPAATQKKLSVTEQNTLDKETFHDLRSLGYIQ